MDAAEWACISRHWKKLVKHLDPKEAADLFQEELVMTESDVEECIYNDRNSTKSKRNIALLETLRRSGQGDGHAFRVLLKALDHNEETQALGCRLRETLQSIRQSQELPMGGTEVTTDCVHCCICRNVQVKSFADAIIENRLLYPDFFEGIDTKTTRSQKMKCLMRKLEARCIPDGSVVLRILADLLAQKQSYLLQKLCEVNCDKVIFVCGCSREDDDLDDDDDDHNYDNSNSIGTNIRRFIRNVPTYLTHVDNAEAHRIECGAKKEMDTDVLLVTLLGAGYLLWKVWKG